MAYEKRRTLTAETQNLLRVFRLVILNLFDHAVLCPKCGTGIVDPKSPAGHYYGVCTTCYKRAQTEAKRQLLYEQAAQKELKAASKALERERERDHAVDPKNRNAGTAWLK